MFDFTTTQNESRDTILIVDDSPSDIISLTTLLKPLNILTKIATSPSKALNLISNNVPSLILLDVYMKDMNGFQLCQKIKQNYLFKRIPIIFITAANDENSIIEGFNSGGQDYITKPYNAPELVARVKSQLKISRQSRKLTQAYRELEYFSYTASHELKSPILIINQLIHILKEQLLTDKEKAELFKNLDEKCKQSTMIIDGLLNLSKAFQHKIAMDQIDAEKICGELVKEFISLNPNRKYSIYIDHQHCPLLSDKILFTILIQNLLSNSFKFTKNKILTQISIHFAIKDNLFSVQIKDNGIGFDNEYKEKVFEVFTRLHPFEEYNGNGIGLATVKKIMHRMQGEVQIHSTPGQGTTVTLLLPQ